MRKRAKQRIFIWINRYGLKLLYPLLLFRPALGHASEGEIASSSVVCDNEPRCVELRTHAMSLAKSRPNEALRIMYSAYEAFPDPRLCYNLGRLYQQLEIPGIAVSYFQRFLASNVEQNVTILAKATEYLKQAEDAFRKTLVQNRSEEKLLPPQKDRPGLPPAMFSPAPDTLPIGTRTDTFWARRSKVRVGTGIALTIGGLVVGGFGIAALHQNGACLQMSVAQTTCLEHIETQGLGIGLLVGGASLALGGTLLSTIPTGQSAVAVAQLGLRFGLSAR